MPGTPPLHIGVDGYNLALPQGTGVATYARTLAEAIAGGGNRVDLVFGLNIPRKVSPELRESLFFGRLRDASPQRRTWRRAVRQYRVSPLAKPLQPVSVAGRVVEAGAAGALPPFDRLYNLSEIFDTCARHFRRYGRFLTVRVPEPPAIMHWTYPLPIRMAGTRNLYTLHDLVPLRLPHASLEDKRYYDMLVRACVRDADHIVTVSDNSRNDIVTLLDADPDRVTNTYQSVSMPPRGDEAALAHRLRRLFDLPARGYFLFFGAIEPKKNLGRLIEAYLQADVEEPLVIVGAEAWLADRELRLLGGAHGTALPGAARIRRIDYLPRPLLLDVMAGARAVAFPSLYEGFGLPALEALALGVPLLTSTAGSLPEVVGDAALCVDPYDVGAIADGIRRLSGDAGLRARLASAGPAQAERFSMTRYQARLEAVYHKVLSA